MFSIRVLCSSVNEFVSTYKAAVKAWTGFCPVCGRQLVRNGGYTRTTPRELGPFRVQLVECKEHGSHALIPCLVLPYQRVLAEQQEAALIEKAEHKPVEEIAERFNVEPKTVYQWWKSFCERAGEIRDYVAKGLAKLSESTRWMRECDASPSELVLNTLRLLGFAREKTKPTFPYCRLSFLAYLNPLLCLTQRQLLRRKYAVR